VRQLQTHLRVEAPRDYCMLHVGLEALEHTVLTQHFVKKGLQVLGQAGADAVISEMTQLHDMNAIIPQKANMMMRQEKKDALEHLMFLKKKRCGRIKGRGCANGRKRLYKTKEETRLPTVTMDGLFLSCVIDAKEGRDVATVDIPRAFLQAKIDEVMHMRLTGPLAMLLAKVDKNLYEKYITTEKGKPVMYVKLACALYGTLQAALLFWKDLTTKLQEWGFTINPYDTYVGNKDMEGTQCTILWHVDDLKISHVIPAVVNEIIVLLNEQHGKHAPLTVNRGKVHDFLGIVFSLPSSVHLMERPISALASLRGHPSGDTSTPCGVGAWQLAN